MTLSFPCKLEQTWHRPGQTAQPRNGVCLLAAKVKRWPRSAGMGRHQRMLPDFTRRATGSGPGQLPPGGVRPWGSCPAGQSEPELAEPCEEMHRKSDLFVLHRKTCSSPSVLIVHICWDSRTWPRIESWPTSVFMTKGPSFYPKISCFSFKAGNK